MEGLVVVLLHLLFVEVDGARLGHAGIIQAALQVGEVEIVRILQVLLCIIGAILLGKLTAQRLRRWGCQRVGQFLIPLDQAGFPRRLVHLLPGLLGGHPGSLLAFRTRERVDYHSFDLRLVGILLTLVAAHRRQPLR